METKRKSIAATILVALAIVLVPLVVYVAGYFWLGELATTYGLSARPRVVRVYPSRLLAAIFRPAAMIESAVTPHDVITAPQSGPLLYGQ